MNTPNVPLSAARKAEPIGGSLTTVGGSFAGELLAVAGNRWVQAANALSALLTFVLVLLISSVSARAALTVNNAKQIRGDSNSEIPAKGSIPAGVSVYFDCLPVDTTGATIKMEVELRKAGQSFTGTPTVSSVFVASGTRPKTSTVSGLTGGGYIWRYRVVNSKGVVGNWVPEGNPDFVVLAPAATAPTVQTNAATSLTASSAVVNAIITADGGASIIDRRFEWGTSAAPNGSWTATNITGVSISVTSNSYSATLSGLSANTEYYFRPWVRNSSQVDVGYGVGWNIGSIVSFRTSAATPTPKPALSVTPTSASISATAGSLSIAVANTGGSYFAGSPSTGWVRVSSGGEGGNSGTLVLAYDANVGAQRSATIQISAAGATNSPTTVTLTQAAGGGGGQRLSGKKIGVDAGHGGTETGAVGPTGLTEKAVNLATAMAAKKYLEADGATVAMTRTTDVTMSLASRSSFFVTGGVHLAVSVHHNAGGVNTTMTFIYCDMPLDTRGALASAIVRRLGASTGIPISQAPASTADTLCGGRTDWKTGLAGVGQANLHMVREPERNGAIPSVLAEVSFISDATEEAKLRDADYLDKNGWAIYAGIAEYYGLTPIPRSSNPVPSISISPTSANNVAAIGASGQIVSVISNGAWTAVPNEYWLEVTAGTSGSGNGTVSYSVAANTATAERTGTLTIGGQTFTVKQSGASFATSISPSATSNVAASGVTELSVAVTSNTSWSATSNVDWLRVTAGASGSGNGTVTISVAANGAVTGRTGTITIGAQTFTVAQNGAVNSTTISPTSANTVAAEGVTGQDIAVSSGGSWTATSQEPWVLVTSGSSGAGNGVVTFKVEANTSLTSRIGTIDIGGQIFTITQVGATASATISPTGNNNVAASGASGLLIAVNSSSPWSAVRNSPWIEVTNVSGNQQGSANGSVTYSVAANMGASSRTGTITIAGLTFTVTQNGASAIAPLITSASAATFTVGQLGSFVVTATGNPTPTFTANALPSWLTLDSASGVLSGTAPDTAEAAYRFTIVASNGASPTAIQEFALTVRAGAVIPTARRFTIAGGVHHTLLIKEDRSLWGFGDNGAGQLGDGTTLSRQVPVHVASDVVLVASVCAHSVWVKSDGTLWGTGNNQEGQLGDGTTTSRSAPRQIASNVIFAATGYFNTWFIKADGTLWGIGGNSRGQLGDGTTTSRRLPVQIAAEVVTVAGGAGHTVFLKKDGTAWAMGWNYYGELGDGTSIQRATPVFVARDVTAIAAGAGHTLLLKTGGTLWSAGSNFSGQLGDGTTYDRYTLTQVATNVASMAAGFFSSAFVKTDGTLWVMGGNQYGRLGDGTTTDRLVPTQVASDVATAALGQDHIIFEKKNGSWWAAGANSFGELGSGDRVGQLSPIQVNTSALIIVPPAITSQPSSYAASTGGQVVFNVIATGTLPLSYQWMRNGVAIAGANGASYPIQSITTADFGSYSVRVSNAAGTATSAPAALTAPAVEVSRARLFNVSFLAGVDPNEETTVGVVIGGRGTTGTKSLVARAAGPSLEALGVRGVMGAPQMTLTNTGVSPQVIVATNGRWGGLPVLAAAFAQVGAFPYMSPNSNDSAILQQGLNPGNYTMRIKDAAGGGGNVIAEFYDATPAGSFTSTTPRLINVSALKRMSAGTTLAMGYVVEGQGTIRVLIRAVGPTLDSAFAIGGVLPNPKLELFDNTSRQVIASNSGWGGSAALTAAFSAVGAFNLNSASSKDSAVLVTLSAGQYSARVSDPNGGGGNVLVEVYEVQ